MYAMLLIMNSFVNKTFYISIFVCFSAHFQNMVRLFVCGHIALNASVTSPSSLSSCVLGVMLLIGILSCVAIILLLMALCALIVLYTSFCLSLSSGIIDQ